MKKLFLGLTLSLFSVLAFAQTAFEKAMQEKVSKIATCKTPEDFTALANDFTRIGDKEKTQWLPYYYATLATIQNGRLRMREGKTDTLDANADAAEKLLTKSEELSPENPENYILRKLIHNQRLIVDPQQRFMTEGALGAEALARAGKLQPENPRITLLQAEDLYYTPEQFGGSKEKAKELFQKAIQQFAAFKTKTSLDPNWGKEEAEYFLKPKP